MPKRTDIKSILILGAGPIVIGQACEFDYSGAQACKALREEGFRVILVNSNPATIMTDPAMADATYIEPIKWQSVAKIIEKERPDALLPTMGGQTALNCALDLERHGVLEKFGVEMIGANADTIDKAEDRSRFDKAMKDIGLECPRSGIAHSMEEANAVLERLGFPCIIRPSFTMGGTGGGIAYNREEFEEICARGLDLSPTKELLIDESLIGWKEYEMEVVRDKKDNCIIVCSIENFDPMGVHTGDSLTVAPAQTLTDKEYQRLRDASIAVLRKIGVDTGGSNVQFGISPTTGRVVVIEMNPRVSRSSALASKATGYPIAKMAAKLAIGYTLDEIVNDITKETPACFEPTLDYVVVKAPRFAFEKFPGADGTLTTTMKSVGEAMAIGRNFTEAFGKVLRSLETKRAGFWTGPEVEGSLESILAEIATPTDGRIYGVAKAFELGASVEQVFDATAIDPWFLDQIQQIVELGDEIRAAETFGEQELRYAKHHGFSDRQIAELRPQQFADEDAVRALRVELGVHPVYKTVDTCAAEFEARTPYHYSAYELDPDAETEVAPQTERPKVLILGSGPNRIGQGIEFDYSCVHAALTLSDAGYETVMVNCNPETVSTDYDTADRLYFEPLTFEDVLEVYRAECESGTVAGVIVQLGGQTPLGLARRLEAAGVPIVGTSPSAIDLAEDRGEFGHVLDEAGLPAAKYGTATTFEGAREIAAGIGYPVLVRPSYVLGGRGMEIVYDEKALETYIANATEISDDRPVLVDRFLDDAVEIDVDALCDGTDVYIGGIMEHIEEAGIHSGDSACALPPITLGRSDIENVRRSTAALAKGIGVKGLLNVQYALKDDILYVLEANPRASRTVPFVSKATGVQLAKACARVMLGETIAELRTKGLLPAEGDGSDAPLDAPIAVKEAVLPFNRFRRADGTGVDTLLSPEMKSTGEVMGLDSDFGRAFAKSQTAAYGSLPTSGAVFVSIANKDKRSMIFPVKHLADLGFRIMATVGTAETLQRNGVPCEHVYKVSDEERPEGAPTIVDRIRAGDVAMVINTPWGNAGPRIDGYEIRSAAVAANIPCVTTVQGAAAAIQGIEAAIRGEIGVRSIQRMQAGLRNGEQQS